MPARPPRRRPLGPAAWAAPLLVVVLVASSCGGDGGDGGVGGGAGLAGDATTAAPSPSGSRGGPASPACGPPVEEELDPNLTHLVVGAPEPSFLTDPPTSGPHVVGNVPSGLVDRPLRGSEQVALLEEGHVLVQYRDLAPADVATLEGLVGDDVTVAPNPRLPGRVVATAWTVKQVCDDVDVDVLAAFVDVNVGRGPGDG